jgi:WD40 repeat protein
VANGRAVIPEIVHSARVNDVTFSPDGKRFATAGGDRAVRIWDTTTGNALTPPLWHPAPVKQALFSPDGRCLAGAGEDGSVLLWDAVTGELAAPPLHYPNRHDRIRVHFSRDGRRLLIARACEVVWVQDLAGSQRSLADLTLQAQVLSAHRLDPVAGQLPLDVSALSNAWQKLRGFQGPNLPASAP